MTQQLAAEQGIATGLVMGTGDYVYDVVRPWGRMTGGFIDGEVASVTVGPDDRVYAYRRGDPPVIVFAPDGRMLDGWGTSRITDAHGIGMAPNGNLLACDRDQHEVLKLSPKGEVLLSLGKRGRPALQAPFNHPADVCAAPNGEIYVADGYGNSAVHRFAPDGKHLLSWGEPGTGPGQFTTPHAVWVTADERVYVADRENNRVQVFRPDGEFLMAIGDLYKPMDIYGDADGVIYVTDQIPRISMYSPDGTLIARGRPSLMGAHGVWGDSLGNLYLAEATDHRLVKLVRRPAGAA